VKQEIRAKHPGARVTVCHALDEAEGMEFLEGTAPPGSVQRRDLKERFGIDLDQHQREKAMEGERDSKIGIDIDKFIDGKIDIHALYIMGIEEWYIWLEALKVCKHRGMSKSQVIEKFSKIPGFDARKTETQVSFHWDKI
jgi:hypothetical protein